MIKNVFLMIIFQVLLLSQTQNVFIHDIDYYDNDSFKDTLFSNYSTMSSHPAYLSYGNDTSKTYFNYPSINYISHTYNSGTISSTYNTVEFDKLTGFPIDLNGDSIKDILFTLDRISTDTLNLGDTSKVFLLIGHDSLRYNNEIDLGSLNGSHYSSPVEPFNCIELDYGNGISAPVLTDYSTSPSFRLETISFIPSNPQKNTIKEYPDLIMGDMEVYIYPNPANYFINLDILNGISGEYTVRIYNLEGRVLQENTLDINSSDFKTTIDLQDYMNGTYILEVQSLGVSVNKQIVISK